MPVYRPAAMALAYNKAVSFVAVPTAPQFSRGLLAKEGFLCFLTFLIWLTPSRD